MTLLLWMACIIAGDSDLDGFEDSKDCAPLDPSSYPGAYEKYYDGDEIDQNCDGYPAGVNPCTAKEDGWSSLLPQEDAEGDHQGYVFDIREHEAQLVEHPDAGRLLHFRTTSWQAFDKDDGQFQIDMHFNNGWTGFNLSYDSVKHDSDNNALQMWGSVNNWIEPLNDVDHLIFDCPADDKSIALGVRLDGLDMWDQGWLHAYVQTGWWVHDPENNYVDDAPDNVLTDYGTVCLDDGSHLKLLNISTSDSAYGDGDGLISPGETIVVDFKVQAACEETGNGFRAELTLSGLNVAAAEVVEGTTWVNEGGSLSSGELATADTPFQIKVLEDSAVGTNKLIVDITFYSGDTLIDSYSEDWDVVKR